MKYGTCASLCLSRSCQRGNDPGQMGHCQRFLVLVSSGVMVLWVGKDDAGTLG